MPIDSGNKRFTIAGVWRSDHQAMGRPAESKRIRFCIFLSRGGSYAEGHEAPLQPRDNGLRETLRGLAWQVNAKPRTLP
jgi:hypothetical protein